MIQELIYTSAHRGLKPGTRGFCTVAHTRGMTSAMIRLLESLSAWRGTTPNRARNQPGQNAIFSQYRAQLQHQKFDILSRIDIIGGEHTNRDNKLAHHIVLDYQSRPPVNPAQVLGQPIFHTRWQHTPRLLDPLSELPLDNCRQDQEPNCATAWQTATGDPGWAGVLARHTIAFPQRPAYLVYEPGMDMLPLLSEALNLLPPKQRWYVGFSTNFNRLPAGVSCQWRCCTAGAQPLKDPRLSHSALILDFTKPMGTPPLSPEVQAARDHGRPSLTPPGTDRQPTAAETVRVAAGDTVRVEPTPERPRLRLKRRDGV